MEPLRVMDLFAGCGGFAEGFRTYAADELEGRQAFRIVAAVEFDRAAVKTFKANHQAAAALWLDVAAFDPYPFVGQIDVIAGGPFSHGFSGFGNEQGDDPRRRLWEDYTRVVAVVRPKIFVLENVDRFATSDEYGRLEEAVQPGGPLSDYTLARGILNSADYGVPQARRRFIVIGTHKSLDSAVPLPAPTHAEHPSVEGSPSLFADSSTLLPWNPVDAVFDRPMQMTIGGTNLPERHDSDGITGPFRTSLDHS